MPTVLYLLPPSLKEPEIWGANLTLNWLLEQEAPSSISRICQSVSHSLPAPGTLRCGSDMTLLAILTQMAAPRRTIATQSLILWSRRHDIVIPSTAEANGNAGGQGGDLAASLAQAAFSTLDLSYNPLLVLAFVVPITPQS